MLTPVLAGRRHVAAAIAGAAFASFTVGCGSDTTHGYSAPANTAGSAGTMNPTAGAPGAGGAPVSAGSGGAGNAGATPGTGGVPIVGTGGAVVSSSGGVPAGTGGASAAGAAGAGAGGAQTGPAPYELSINIPPVAPGGEDTQCVQVKLPNTAPVDIVKVHNVLSKGSHHFIVSALTAANAAEMPLTPCRPFRGALQGGPLAITQKKDDEVNTPAGVSYSLSANQVISLELHYINTGTDTLSVNATSQLYPAPAGANLQQSSVLLVGTGTFSLPPMQATSTGPRYIQMPPGLDGVNYFAMTGHTHRLGTNVTVGAAANATAQATSVYAPTPYEWDSPVLVPLSPAAQLPTGGGFVLKCDWNNTTNATVTFGESALAEMCFFWAYYYPKKSSVPNLIVEGLGPVDSATAMALGF
jgi:hypothetical protein